MKRLWGLRGRLIVLLIVLMIVPLLIFTLLFQRRLVRIMKEDQSAAAGRYESEEVGEGERPELLEEYDRELYELRVLFWGMAGVVVLLVFVFILFVTRPLIISVDRILDGMKRVENGDYSVRLTMNRGASMEMREIIEGFNSMTEQAEQLLAQVRKAAEEQKNAEISALEAQIDPHFLYNTLDTINWKAIAREEYEISEMVGDLGDILRYAIKDAGGITTLGKEIVWLKKYIRLQQEKLGYEVQIFCDISSEAAGAGMHKMLLQPLVENSIRHGLEAKLRQPILVITGLVRENMLHVTIGDNGRGMEPEMVRILNEKNYHRRNHFGIENVRKRLTLYDGEAAGLSFESRKGQYTRVTLRLPMMEVEKIENNNRGRLGSDPGRDGGDSEEAESFL